MLTRSLQWNHTFESFQSSADGSVMANFSSPSGFHAVEGCIIVGCDGSRSRVRSSLFPDPNVHNNYQLPVRLLGASTIYPKELTAPVRKLDPFFFQGGDPNTDAAHWFSFLDSPASSGREDESRECQILVSWPYRPGFLGQSEPLEIPKKGIERVQAMKRIAYNWADPFRTIVQSIPDETDVKTISLEDWVPPQDGWNAVSGSDCVILVGDSAHAMTMYRGEAANHGIADVHLLVSHILPVLTKTNTESGEISEACKAYTRGMVERAAPAVLRSRTACLDAHDYKKINDDSPLIQKRVICAEPAAPLALEVA
jgi:2-polyprenyl-6-methoxyphenol hydroxylase-like FAD-dependent oxidoreductase